MTETEYCFNFLFVQGPRAERDTFFQKNISQETGDLNIYGSTYFCEIFSRRDYDRIYFKTVDCQHDEAAQKNMTQNFPDLKFSLLFIAPYSVYFGKYISYFEENEMIFLTSREVFVLSIDCDDSCDNDDDDECEKHKYYFENSDVNFVNLYTRMVKHYDFEEE